MKRVGQTTLPSMSLLHRPGSATPPHDRALVVGVLGCCVLQTMTGLPSTMVVEPEKIATLSYHLSFQIETGRRAHLTKSRDTQWPQSCARTAAQ